jgi:long-chain fatty acid transport protein
MTDFADAQVTGSSHSAAFHIGAIIKAERMRIGIRYLSRSTSDIQGDAEFTQIGTGLVLPPGNPLGQPGGTPVDSLVAPQFTTGSLTPQHASVDIPAPAQLIFGVQVQATDKLSLLLDVQRTFWSAFEVLTLTFEKAPQSVNYEDYRNTTGIRFGAEYALTRSITIRGGTLYHEAAAPDQTVTPLLPEAERAEGTLGVSFNIGRNGRLDLAYQHIWQADRRGRIVDSGVRGPEGASANTGLYTATGTLFGANLTWGF